MAAPAVYAGVIVAGALINALGKAKANAAEAQARRANAQLMIEEADYFLKSSERDIELYGDEITRIASENQAMFAKQGFNMTGSALDVMAQNAFRASAQVIEMRTDAIRKARLMKLKAESESNSASSVEGLTKYEVAGSALDAGTKLLALKK